VCRGAWRIGVSRWQRNRSAQRHVAIWRSRTGPSVSSAAASRDAGAGKVMHARMKPKVHRFNYSVFCLLIDIDRLDEAHASSALFSVRHFNLLGFRQSDHGDGSAQLSPHIRSLAWQAGVDLTGGRLLLLCYPRVLGFVFNPISVYFGYDLTGALAIIIYEVRNTFGEMHTYVAKIEPGQLGPEGVKQERDKLFYVSPFMDMPLRYHFRLRPPDKQVAVRILETDAEGPILAATFHGGLKDLTSFHILKACLKMPFMTAKVVAGIHWEALKLWMKGVVLVTRPAPPEKTSFSDAGLTVSSLQASRKA
jgi:uncharacterized protein